MWMLTLLWLAGCNGAADMSGSVPASEVTLATLDTADWDSMMTGHRGKIVVVDTWATWCGSCVEGFPKFVKLSRKYAGQEVEFISVSVDGAGAHDAAQNFLQRKGAAFTNYRLEDEGNAWWDKWEIKSIPVVMVFDREGNLARKFDMDDPDNQFTYEQVEQLVAEMTESN
jgi:thiol-disulfide isomerase/thioredoxin